MADFQIANYEMDGSGFRPIKVLSTTIFPGNPNGGTAGTGSYVRAGGSKRAYGTVARQVTLSRNIGTSAAYSSATVSVSIPVLTKAAFAAFAIGSTVTYNGVDDWVVVGKQSEVTR